MPSDIIQINASLLAHIGADAESLGSGYEGNTFQSTTGYLCQYLNTLPLESTVQLAHLKALFKALAAREKALMVLRHQPFNKSAYQHYIDTLSNEIKTLSVGATHLFPGGWQTESGGHAMLYRFKKTDNDTLIFEVIQSGEGIGYHEQHSSIEKELYAPLKSFSINLKTLTEKTFETELPLFIERLIRPNLLNHPDHPHSAFSEGTLYEEILPSISFLEGTEFISNEILECEGYTGSQLSGTCAERVIHQLLKFQFASLDAYQQFILNYKIYALNDYLEKHPNNPDLELVEDTYRNNLRLYGRLLVKNTLTESAQVSIEANIDVARQRIHMLKRRTPAPPSVSTSRATSVPNTHHTVNISPTTDVPRLKVFTAPEPSPVAQATSIPPIKPENLLPELTWWESEIQRLSRQNEHDMVLEQTKSLMLAINNITLPKLSKNDRDNLQSTLERLKSTYFTSKRACFDSSKSLPEHLFVHLSLNLLNIALFEQTVPDSQFSLVARKTIGDALKMLQMQPYLASTNPQLDMAFNKVIQSTSTVKLDTPLDCYLAIINKQPDLKKQLQAKYDALPEAQKPTPAALRQALEREQQQVLWYVLEHKDKLKTDPSFKSIVQPILAMQLIEENAYQFHQAAQQRSWLIRPSTFQLDRNTNTLVFESALNQLKLWFTTHDENHPVYPLKKHTLQGAVFSIHEQARAENDIQLKAYQCDFADWKKDINKKESLQLRELYHLRTAPEAQVDLTLDYFLRHLTSLRDANMQQYLEANLFQPPLLLDCLKKSSAILTPFYQLINRGIRSTSKNGQPSQDSLVFIRLYFLLNRYLNTYDELLQFGDTLERFKQDIDVMLSSRIEDKHIQYSLHQYRFLTAIEAYKSHKPLDANFYQDLLTSYFFLQAHNNPKQTQSLQSTYELKHAFKTFQSIIQAQGVEKFEAYLPQVLAAMDMDTSSLQLEKTGKTFVFRNTNTGMIQYQIDIHHGLIYHGAYNQALIPTPLSIKANPQCIALGLHQVAACFTSADKDYFYFERADGDVRVIRKRFSQALHVQKKWTINGKEAWYEQKDAMSQEYQSLPCEIGLDLPKILRDNTVSNWVKCDAPHNVLITRHDTPILCSTNPNVLNHQHLIFKDVNPETHHTTNSVLISKPASQKHIIPLLQFEDAEFLTAFLDERTGMIEVCFERYGFSVQYHTNDSSNTIYLTGTPYTLCDNPNLFSKHIACLTFEHRTSKEEVSKKCILPIQPFLLTPSPLMSKTKSVPIHDISGEQQAKYAAKTRTATGDALPFNYHLSEQLIELPLDKAGTPYAGNCEDALYLTYVYLAAKQPEKALETLNHCQNNLGGLRGTAQELAYLHWINHQLGGISNPRIVACQLRATALLTDFLSQGKSIPDPEYVLLEVQTGNAVYQKAQQEERQAFLAALPGHIATQFSTYQRMLRHMPSTFKLGDNEVKSLLSYFKKHSAAKPHGALAYAAQILDLKTLKKELVHLNGLKKAGQQLTPNQTERLGTLENHIAHTEAVAKQTSHLIEDTVDLTLPESCEKFRIDYPTYFSEPCRKYVFKALTSDLDESTFKADFGLFLATAQSDQLTREQKEAYTLFCIRMLRQYRFSKAPKDVGTQLLINLLYRVLTSNQTLYTPHDPCVTELRTRAGHVLKPVSLTYLFDQIKGWEPPPIIPVLSIKNVHEEVLQTSEEMLATLDKEVRPKHPLIIESTGTPHLSLHSLLVGLDEHFARFKTAYLDNQASHKDALEALRARITPETPHKALFEIEKEAGALELAHLNTQNNLAEAYFKDKKGALETLQANASQDLADCEAKMETLWDIILQLANRPPENTAESPNKHKLFGVEIEAEERQLLGERELYSLYIQGDLVRYTEKTNLGEADIRVLHQYIHQYLHHKLHRQHLERFNKKLNDAIKEPENSHKIRAVVQQLMQENTPDAVNNTAYTFLQCEENILLRKNQVAALKSLYPAPETLPKESVEKLIMGGGKSTVILPLWAKQKADSSNLVILEVPRALLHSNHADMNQTSFKWFGQCAHKFEFARESNASPEALEHLYHFFREVMTNQDYLVTTGESMQSLQLKYLEMLDRKPEVTDTDAMLDWERQVQSLDNILNLLKSHGYAMIDEVHQGLITKQKLNYTSGEDLHISPFLIDANVKFYQFLSPIQWTNPESETFTLAKLIKNPRLVKGDDEWQSIVETICNTLIETRDGPLKRIFENYPNLTPLQIKAYIQNTLTGQEETEVMAIINTMLTDDNTLLAFYKTELKTQKGIFKQTASRQYRVNYGPSILEGKTPQERAVAIPYGGNDNPRESSRFANINEAMNYTTQAMLITGIEKPLVIDLIRTWQNEAEAEYRQLSARKEVSYEGTNAATIFKDLMQESPFRLGLGEVDLESDEHIDMICKTLQENSWVTYQILQNYILPQITFNEETLSSNAYHHVDMYHSVHGVSGTPANHKSFHQRMRYNPTVALGSDGLVIGTTLAKNSQIYAIDYETPHQFLDDLFDKTNTHQDISAIIDVCAMFQGQKNLDVASAIATKLRESGSKVQYVLYFDNEVLCAKPCEANKAPIRLGTTKVGNINQILNCTPEERFTYYDQVHTTGTDIKQGSAGRGLVLVDHKTPLTSTLQGTMRMRDFILGEQSVDYVVPPALTQYAHTKEHPGHLEAFINKMADNEANSLSAENFVSTLEKMTAMVRKDILDRLLAIPNMHPHKKHAMHEKVRSVFFENHRANYFEQYGKLIHEEDARSILERHKANILANWHALLEKIATSATDVTHQTLDDMLQDIIEGILPHCDPMQLSNTDSPDESAENELELHEHVEAEHEALQEEAFFNPKLTAQRYQYPTFTRFNSNPITHYEPNFFSANLKLSKNFSETYIGQGNTLFNAFMKPAHVILFSYKDGQLTATLITNREFRDLQQQALPDATWFSDLQGNCLWGKKPAYIESLDMYHNLMEQVLFFNGDLEPLMQRPRFSWLNQESDKKIAFFEAKILPYREATREEVNRLKQIFERATYLEVYNYISEHLDDPHLIRFNFKSIHPEIDERDTELFLYLIETLQHIKIDWEVTNIPDAQAIMLKHHLPKQAFTCVKKYCGTLDTLEKIARNFDALMDKQHQTESIQTLCRIFKTTPEAIAANYAEHPETQLSPKLYCLIKLLDSSYIKESESFISKFFDTTHLSSEELIEIIQKTSIATIANSALNTLINHINSVDDTDTSGLAENERLIDALIPHVSPTISTRCLLNIHKGMTSALFERIIHTCDINSHTSTILKHPLCIDKTVCNLLNNPKLDKENFDIIIKEWIPSLDTLHIILRHPYFELRNAQKFLQDSLLPSNILKQLIELFSNDNTLMRQIIQHPNCDADTLEHLLQKNLNLPHPLITAVITHAKVNITNILPQLFQLARFNTDVAKQLLQSHHLAEDALIQLLKLPRINICLLWNDLCAQPYFNTNTVEEILKTYRNLPSSFLKGIIDHRAIQAEILIKLLLKYPGFDSDVTNYLLETRQHLSFESLITLVTRKNLRISVLWDALSKQTHFNADVALCLLTNRNDLTSMILRQIITQTELLTPAVIDTLIQRSLLNAELALYLITTAPATLSEGHIITILDTISTEDVIASALKHPHITVLTLRHLLQQTKNLSKASLQTIITHPCITGINDIFMLLSQQTNFNADVANALLTVHPTLSNEALKQMIGIMSIDINQFSAKLFQLSGFTTEVAVHLLTTRSNLEPQTLKALIQAPNVDTNGIVDALLNHSRFDTDTALCLLEAYPNLSSSILIQLICSPQVVTEVIRSKIKQNAGYNSDVASELNSDAHITANIDVVINVLKNHPDLAVKDLKEILKRYASRSHAFAEPFINHPSFDTELALSLLNTNHNLEISILDAIIHCNRVEKHRIATALTAQKHCSSHIAQMLLENESLLTSEQLVQIVENSRYEKIIPFICQHNRCDDNVFKSLLKKYNNVPLDNLKQMTNSTKNHDIFFDALTHKNHTQTEKNKHKKALKEKTDNAFKKANEHQDQKLMLFALIQKLEQKSYQFSLKAIKNPKKYAKASKVSFTLYHALIDTVGAYYRNEIDDAKFLKESKNALETALPEMQKHRGHKQLLYDIANCIAFILCIGRFILSGGKKLRFFEAKTDTQKTLIEIDKNISSNKPNVQ